MNYKYVKSEYGVYRIFIDELTNECTLPKLHRSSGSLPKNWKYINLIEYYKYMISVSSLYEL